MNDLASWIEKHASFTPQKTALAFEGSAMSYAELSNRIKTCAAILKHRHQIKEGERVAFLGHNSPDFLILFFACARLRALFLPLNWRLAAPEHLYILQDASPRLCVCEAHFKEHAEGLKESLPDCQFLAADFSADDWLSLSSSQTGLPKAPAPAHGADDAPVLLVYTSGTTGHPKGAVLTQKAIQWNALNSLHMHDMTAKDTVLTVLPMFHVGGLNIQTTPALYCGATVELHRKFNPSDTLKAIEDARPTLTVLVPATLQALISHPDWSAADLSSLKSVSTGSSVVPTGLVQAFHDRKVPVLQVYGSTETCPIAIYLKSEDAVSQLGSTGKPALHCEARVVDDHGTDIADNQSGEILIKGPNLMRGYWNNETESKRSLREGWFYTGDVGYRDANGFFYINDRKKDVIISGGENIYPAELELVLNEISGLAQATVVGRDDKRWVQVPVAVVSLLPGYTVTKTDILKHFDDRLARFKHPKDVVILDQLPSNAMGKVQKFAVRQLLETTRDQSFV
ncbi:2-succinylbenzoate--CoA ligase [Roseibium sp. TrichSKD4]|uniref:class I adenylate-forming enzyme family protein n=1 Tax=Roseibium sp. TrichSKD4 TaxID=744980 RepID=UPI0001E5645F|nr:AMP-binding protein [Roseibium sp. TrichSKD4]EFO34142.1 2-succinylbenzoate--CoA ligase [Roseibium sp. TrichSKD4]